MTKSVLGKITLGFADGKKEATEMPEFWKYYYDGLGLNAQLSKMDKYLITGRKGSGKTLLAFYFAQNENEGEASCSTIESLQDLKYEAIAAFKKNNAVTEDYQFWKFVIWTEYIKILLEDAALTLDADLTACLTYIQEIFPERRSIYSIVNNGLQINLEAFSQKIGMGIEKKGEKIVIDMNELVFDIERRALRLSQRTSRKITLFLDDLDSNYANSTNYIESIKTFLLALASVNDSLRLANTMSRVVAIMRTDILNRINGANIGKIKRDAQIEIDWTTRITLSTPVMKMLLNKIRQSLSLPSKFNNETIYNTIFPEMVKGEPAYKYILDRTMIRPRDLVSYIKFIVEEYPDASSITSEMILNVERKYSSYLKEELRNEMYGTFSDFYIESIFRLLKLLKLTSFGYSHISIAFDQYKANLGIDSLDECLSTMFDYGIIGNNTEKGYSFKYRDLDSVFMKSEQIIIHPGLAKDISR